MHYCNLKLIQAVKNIKKNKKMDYFSCKIKIYNKFSYQI